MNSLKGVKAVLLVFCFLFSVFCSLSLTGCGYTTRGFVYDINDIYIPPVVNKIDITAESRGSSSYRTFPILIEKNLTNEIVSRFNSEGGFTVVSYEEGALKLTCSVTDYQKDAISYSDNDDVEEQRLRLYIAMKLVDPTKVDEDGQQGKILEQKTIVGETTYFLEGPNRTTEAAARQDLIEDASRRILEAVIEQW